jgi:DNA polymerase-1
MMPTLALLDGHSLAYRAFYALPADLATTSGQVTNAVYGFTSMLIKLLGDEAPDAVVVAWDVRGKTFRTDAFPEYKAQRESPPSLFASQLPLIREVLDALRITQLGVEGVEADDVIATLARQAAAEDWRVLVVTGDRDAFQLVDDRINVLYTRRGISDMVVADEAWVVERYGVTPVQYVDYAALRGDTSDNLPGVPGVGEKTAAKLISNYRDIDGVFTHLDEQTPKLRENLAASEEQTRLNRRLMRLVDTVEFDGVDGPIELDAFRLREWDPDEVRRVFDGLAFRVLWDRLQELGGGAAVEAETIDVDVGTATTADALTNLAATPPAVEMVHDAGRLAGIVLTDGKIVRFVPVDRLEIAGDLLGRGIVAHDAKPFLRAMLEMDLDAPPVAFDTALAAYLVNPAQRTPDLSELAYKELGISVTDDEDAGDTDAQGTLAFDDTGPDLEAAGRRAVAVHRLVDAMTEQVEARGGADLLASIELPLVSVLARMEAVGVGVDRDFLETFGNDLRSRLAVIEQEIHTAAGGPFNVNSTLQLREVLFDRLGLPVLKKTPKGAPSTDASVLEKLRDEHPLVDGLLRYRELEKLRSTYVDALVPLIEPDGRIRGRFNQMAAATGRLSQEEPNLQNIPVRSEEGRALRAAFVAAEGYRLLVADYSQIELRILAHLSGDPGLIDAFERKLDIHTATAARVAGVAPEEVTPDERRRAKMINFGLLYGMEAYGLAQRLGIGREEAAAHIEAYFSQFTEVQSFMGGIVAEARSSGYTTTLLGRRRYLPELASSNFRDRQSGERMALNAPIQGSAADIIKKAMVVLDDELRARDSRAEMTLQIHDELVLEVPEDDVDEVTELTVSIMEGVVELRVPLVVDTASGRTLADCKS